MRKLRSENGAITMVTLITIIFMVSFLISSYVLVANKVKTQKEMLTETKAIYEPKLSMEEVYNSYFTNGDVIPIYTVEELLKIGSNENDTINGKAYTYSYSANYLLMNDLEFNAVDEGLESNWLAPYENEDFEGNFEWSGHTIKVTTLEGNTITYDGRYIATVNTTENPKVLTNAVKSNLVNYKIEGNSVQDGEPSPTNPVEIQSVGDLVTDETDSNYGKYKIPVTVEGKNLFDINNPKLNRQYNTTTETIDNGFKYTSTTNGAWTSYTSYALDFNKIAGKTITLSADFKISEENKGMLRLGYWSSAGTYQSPGNTYVEVNRNGKYQVTATIPNEMPEDAIEYAIFFNTSILENMSGATLEVSNIQVEINDKATVYEPYREETYYVFLDEPLRKAGDSEDYIDYEQGKIKRQFVAYTFDGSDDENWKSTKQSETKTCFYISCPNNDEGWRKPNTTYSLSSHFKQNYTNATTVDNNDEEGFAVANTTNILYIGILNSNLDTLDIEGFRKWLSEQKSKGKPLTVIVKNERPDEFIDLPNIQLYKGTNIITVGTEVEPSNISITYNAKQ